MRDNARKARAHKKKADSVAEYTSPVPIAGLSDASVNVQPGIVKIFYVC